MKGPDARRALSFEGHQTHTAKARSIGCDSSSMPRLWRSQRESSEIDGLPDALHGTSLRLVAEWCELSSKW
jgi:hypothetical protein